jgi:hypothetical protein
MVAAAAVAAAAAFNLVCSGTIAAGSMSDLVNPQKKTPIEVVYRIDLHEGRYCTGDCASTLPIYRVTDAQIVFQFSEDKDAGTDSLEMVNRESGEYLSRSRFFGLTPPAFIMTQGTCEKARFTGFPARKF